MVTQLAQAGPTAAAAPVRLDLTRVPTTTTTTTGVIVVDSKLFGDDEKDSAKTPKSGKTPKSRSKVTHPYNPFHDALVFACTLTLWDWFVRRMQNKPISLNSDDKLFAEVRHLNIQAVPPVLEEKSRDTKKTYDVLFIAHTQTRTATHCAHPTYSLISRTARISTRSV